MTEQQKNSKLYKITVIGDIMWDTEMSTHLSKYYNADHGRFDFTSVFQHIRPFFERSDYVIGNLETPISRSRNDLTRKRWEFCSPFEFAEALHDAGVDYVSTANNHCLDRGIKGIAETIACLDLIGLSHSGISTTNNSNHAAIVNIGSLRLALLSYTYGTNAISNKQYLSKRERKMVNLIQEQEGAIDHISPIMRYITHRPKSKLYAAREKLNLRLWPCNKTTDWYEHRTIGFYRKYLLNRELRWIKRHHADVSLINLHIGGQYNTKPNPYTLETVNWLKKKNVNLIIANHEHVVHGSTLSLSKKQLASYAIGNFLSSAGILHPPMDRRSEYSVAVHIYLDAETKSLCKATFSVIKTVYTSEGFFEVWPVYDLIPELSPSLRSQVIKDTFLVVKDFSDKDTDTIMEEYPMPDTEA